MEAQRQRKPEANGFRMTAGRQALLNACPDDNARAALVQQWQARAFVGNGGMMKAIVQIAKGGNAVNVPDINFADMAEFAPKPCDLPCEVQAESDEEILKRINHRFATIEKMVDAAVSGYIRAMIVSGPPGLGKSYTITNKLESSCAVNDKISYIKLTGKISPLGLYMTLHDNRSKNTVILFDDCDSVFDDEDKANLLKAACDSSSKRLICWTSQTKLLENYDTRFNFEGAIVFISNLDFNALIAKGNKMSVHFNALMSRAHYIDMAIKTRRDYLIRIKDVIYQGMLADIGLDAMAEDEIGKYIEENQNKLNELSLRMVSKLAGLYKLDSENWRTIADVTLLR